MLILSIVIFFPIYHTSFAETNKTNITKKNFYVIDLPKVNASLGKNFPSEMNSSSFRQGDVIHLYIKPIGFKIKKTLDQYGDYVNSASFAIGFALAFKNGTVLGSQDSMPIKKIIVDQNGEIIIPFDIVTGMPLPVGDYFLTYNTIDRNSGNEFAIVKNITITR